MLSNDELYKLWDHTLYRFTREAKPHDMSEKVFLAKLWEDNLLAALKKAGYVCTKCSSDSSSP